MIIYKTTNLINGKFYIGKDLKNNPKYLGSGTYLKKAIKKYGKKNFNKEILCECQNINELNILEKYWINVLNAKILGYNIADGGDGGKTKDIPWNKGKKCKSTGKCTKSRKDSISKSRLNTPKVKCEFCKKEIDPGNFKQYHGENCKNNPNVSIEILQKKSNKAKKSMKTQKERGTYSKPKSPIGDFKCPHCEKIGTNYGAMQRHHFNRCPKK